MIYVEHHNPLGKTDYLSIQHIERYRFAISKLSPGQRVLDIACGAGYGMAMLSKYGCKVIGADYDNEAISNACAIWKNYDFVKANALNLPFSDNYFDAIVSFETIEHVYDGRRFLSEMHRVLRPEGTFICSTPNIQYSAHPSFHLKEYSHEEFYELIQRWFLNVERYGQYFKPSDRMLDLCRLKIVASMDKIGIKEVLKRILRRDVKEKVDTVKNLLKLENLLIEQALNRDNDAHYRVQPFIDSKLMRIMVVVAKKENR
jgi:ubiquinone/menaquinone biosynthesis C-methylase UbiE